MSAYRMSKESYPFLYSKLLYKNGQNFLDTQYNMYVVLFQF